MMKGLYLVHIQDQDIRVCFRKVMMVKRILMNYVSVLILTVVIFSGACSSLDVSSGEDELRRFSSDEEINSLLSGESPAQGESMVRTQYDMAVDDGAVEESLDSVDQEVAEAAPDVVDDTAQADDDSASYTETTVQEEEIDEADIVKTDGDHIFFVSDNKLIIVDAEDLEIISEIEHDDMNIREIMMSDGRLVLLGQESGNYGYPRPEPIPMPIGHVGVMPYSMNQRTFISVYDITDVASPEKIEEISLNGRYMTSRLKDGDLYTVVNNPMGNTFTSPIIEYLEGERTIDATDIYHFGTSEESYELAVLLKIDIDDGSFEDMPLLKGSTSDIYMSENNIYLSGRNNVPYTYEQRRIIEEVYKEVLPNDVVMDIERIEGYDIRESTKLNEINFIVQNHLASLNRQDYEDTLDEIESMSERIREEVAEDRDKSVIHRISLETLEYESTGMVPGHIQGRFSLSEKDGHLMVTTTSGNYWRSDNPSKTHLHILDMELDKVGSVRDMAEEERVESVRFIGDAVYITLSREDDSMLVIDVEDPASPSLVAETDVLGRSNLMHPLGDDLLLVVGNSQREMMAYGRDSTRMIDDGLKVWLYDISEASDPVMLDDFRIGGRGSSLETNDLRALMHDSERGLIALPVRENEETEIERDEAEDGIDGEEMIREWLPIGDTLFRGSLILDVSRDEGIDEVARISHLEDDDLEERYHYVSGKSIIRSLVIGDRIYTLSPSMIRANSIEDFSEVGNVTLMELNDSDSRRGMEEPYEGDAVAPVEVEEDAVDDPAR